MAEGTHINSNQPLFPISDNEDSQRSIGVIQDQEYSFNSTKFRADHWQNMHEFEDSNMVQESSEAHVQNNFYANSFLEETKKALGQFQQLKSAQKKVANRGFQPSSPLCKLQPDVQNEPEQRKMAKRKTKIIEKTQKSKKTSKVYKREPNLKNLKSISSEVCDFVESAQTTTYHILFQKFVGSNQDENKNLRRRMYDVINVLSSANILQKKGQVLLKSRNVKKNKSYKKIKHEAYEESRIQELKNLQEQKLKAIREKKKIIEQLKQKNRNLQKLTRRNQDWGDKVPQNNKLYFPLYFCEASRELQVELSDSNHTIKFKSPTMQDQNEGDFQFIHRQIDVLKLLKLRRSKRSYQPIQVNQTKNQEQA